MKVRKIITCAYRVAILALAVFPFASAKLLADLAKKLGVSVKHLTDEEIEDIGMLKFLAEVDRDEVVAKDSVMAKLLSNWTTGSLH